jgi:predicted amidophosphoribosyltransferase
MIGDMIHRSEMTVENATLSLRSTTCPACGRDCKLERASLCPDCHAQLPQMYQHALGKQIGEGYGQALWDVLVFLDAERFHLPPPAASSREHAAANWSQL